MTVAKGTDSKYLLRAGLLVVIGLSLFLLGSLLGPAWAKSGAPLSYNQFENDVKSKMYTSAEVDGNIIVLQTKDGKRLHTEAPEMRRAVELLIKFDIPVTARPVPASGLTWPVVFLLLIPYGLLAFYAFALAKAAAAASAPIRELPPAEHVEHDAEDPEYHQEG